MSKKIQNTALYGIELVRDMEQLLIEMSLFNPASVTAKNPTVVMLEQDLLEVGASSTIAQGVFYMLPLYNDDKLFVRYLYSFNSYSKYLYSNITYPLF